MVPKAKPQKETVMETSLHRLYARANELMVKSCDSLPVDYDSWTTNFPPTEVFRALLVNSELESAGKYAEQAFIHAEKGREEEASKNLTWAEQHYAKADWAKCASTKQIYLYKLDWFHVVNV